jgi:hypothetical protein
LQAYHEGSLGIPKRVQVLKVHTSLEHSILCREIRLALRFDVRTPSSSTSLASSSIIAAGGCWDEETLGVPGRKIGEGREKDV